MESSRLPFSGLEAEAAQELGLRLVRVAVERGIEGEGLTYASPWPNIRIGEQVEVPLGRSKSRGVVIATGGEELLDGLDRAKLKRVAQRLETSLPPDLVELGKWIASYYVAPLGMTLASMVPGAVKAGTGGRVVEVVSRCDAARAEEILVSARLTARVRETWDSIAAMGEDSWPMEPRSLARSLGVTLAPINKLAGLGLLIRSKRDEVRARGYERVVAASDQSMPGATGHELNADQSSAVDGVSEAFGRFGVHLLFGVTGSGKTEVYLRLIERIVDSGRRALVLVPEISLTPQTAGRFESRFAGRVAVLHSGLSASQRNQQWRMASSGEAMVVVGARSAAFAPIADLGLVVVDEEHDGSYKQDTLPRYHGRDVAIKRAQMADCPVVIGSATPSLESWANARSGRYQLWKLRERAGTARLPSVRIVDLAAEQPWGRGGPSAGGSGRGPLMIGSTLRGALVRTLAAGGQAILLLNRRGFATFMHCPACKWTLSCTECDAAMVLHRGRELPRGEVVRCHHCRAERLVPRACEVCGGKVVGLGVGTQRVEEEILAILQAQYPEVDAASSLVRVDADTIRSVRELHEALDRFGQGRARIMLGTQMIAKGLDFPNVRLVGVVSADTALSLPDFRATERTFQLVSQVAGRAGRGEHPGEVIVQTFNPSAPSIRLAAAHDYEGFAGLELATRAAAGLPPAGRMARVVVRDEDQGSGRRRAEVLAATLREEAASVGGVEVEGPAPSVIARIEGWHRWDLIVRAPARPGSSGAAGAVQRVLGAARRRGELLSDAHTAVDVDPVALM